MRTIAESTPSTQVGPSVDTRKSKIFKVHVERTMPLDDLKVALQSFQIGSWESSWEISLQETVNLDTPDKALAAAGFKLKYDKKANNKKRELSLKCKSLDPLVLEKVTASGLSCSKQKYTEKRDIVFTWEKSVSSLCWKCRVGKNTSLTRLSEVYDLFPGLQSLVQCAGVAPLVEQHSSASARHTCATLDVVPQVHARISVHYPTMNDAMAKFGAFTISFQLRVSQGADVGEYLQASKRLYKIFYGTIVEHRICYKGPVIRGSLASSTSAPKVTREYALFLQAKKWEKRDEAIGKLHEYLATVFPKVDFSNVKERVIEHLSLDTPTNTLKNSKMEEAVLKLERNVDSHTCTITCKYKGLDRDIVAAFPVRVSGMFRSSSKLELDVHPRFSRNAVSLVAELPFDVRISCFGDIENIFPGFLRFSGIAPEIPVVVRMFKVKHETCKQMLFLPCGRAAVGRVSLEYPTLADARQGSNVTGGEWIYRLVESAGWEKALAEAMDIFMAKLVRSPYNYEGPGSKPALSDPPSLEDETLELRKTCGIVVVKRHAIDMLNPWRLLLLKRSKLRDSLSGKDFDFPKGKLDAGETELACASRELQEETNIALQDIDLIRDLRYVATRFPNVNGKLVKKQFILFLGIVKSGTEPDVKESDEHAGFVWVPWNGKSAPILGSVFMETCLLKLGEYLPQ